MEFLTGQNLHRAVVSLLRGKNIRCAVAFWGRGAEDLVPDMQRRRVRIVCNLRMGGTNPSVIKSFSRACVKQCDDLHAKVYLCDDRAIVCSANASANGLGFEGNDQSCWIEAGLRTDDVQSIKDWFEELWEEARGISDRDLGDAQRLWNARQRVRPSLKSFGDFDVSKTKELPLVDWHGDGDPWEANASGLRRSIGAFDARLAQRIADGAEVFGEGDRAAYREGTWVLNWWRAQSGKQGKRKSLWWVQVGPILDDAWRFKGDKKWLTVALPAEVQPPPPFDLDVRFKSAFFEVIFREKYRELRTDNFPGDWVTAARRNLMNAFWADLKNAYGP